MPNLAGFAAFARKVGVIPFVPHQGDTRGTRGDATKCFEDQHLARPVPHVPHVPLENNDAENELADRFEERAAILEYDGGRPRPEAERLARIEVFGAE